jgi:hypothetical protein
LLIFELFYFFLTYIVYLLRHQSKMAKVLEDTLGNLEYVMLALCTVGVVLLLAKAYGIGVNVTKDGMHGESHGLRFTVPTHTGASESKYDGMSSKPKRRHTYGPDGMLGSGEGPVFWSNQFVDVETGARQSDGLDDDGSQDGVAWQVAGPSNGLGWNKFGAKVDGMSGKGLDAALAGGNVVSP